MAGRIGRPPKRLQKTKSTDNIVCCCCGSTDVATEYVKSGSLQFRALTRLPYCKSCRKEIFETYLAEYQKRKYDNAEYLALRRCCMIFDWYYNEKLAMMTNDEYLKAKPIHRKRYTLLDCYQKSLDTTYYDGKTYDDTINDEARSLKRNYEVMSTIQREDVGDSVISVRAVKFFGEGYSDEDYAYLQGQYEDWIARNECNTKTQEEMFKEICFTQLALLKAHQQGLDTKDLNTTLMKQLDVANLQPKQNAKEKIVETHTFGTMLELWEEEEPLPEIDEELKDIDKIGLYIDVFFRGHMAKMLGLKNSLSRLYDKFISKYTATPVNYQEDATNEVLFDAVFGGNNKVDDF